MIHIFSLLTSTDWADKVESRETAILQSRNDDDYKRTMSLLETQKESALQQWSAAETSCEGLNKRIQKVITSQDLI